MVGWERILYNTWNMGELAPEFKQKIADFDGDSAVSKQEKDIMFYVESYAWNMPPEYLNRLIDAIRAKLKDKECSKAQIGLECEKAINDLSKTIQKEMKELESRKTIHADSYGEQALKAVASLGKKAGNLMGEQDIKAKL